MFSQKQLEPPTKKQLAYIKVLEQQTKLKFTGNTTVDAIKFIQRAKNVIEESKMIKRMVERQDEKFPYIRVYEHMKLDNN